MPRSGLQLIILRALAARDTGLAPPTPRELADEIASDRGIRSWDRKPTTEAEQVAGALRRMEAKRLVMKMGTASNGARCWAINPVGLDALKSMGG